MNESIACSPLVAPFVLAVAAALARLEPGIHPRRVLVATRLGAILSLSTAAAAVVLLALRGPLQSPLLGVGEIGLSIRLDALSVAMLVLVAFLGAVVLEYSRNYLDGDARHGVFLGRLALTIAAVMLLVLSGNLVQLAVMWLLTSLALHRLLLFYPSRPGAIVAARKKFIVARLGDAALVVAAVLLSHAFGTADLGLLLARASAAADAGTVPIGVSAAAALLVATAALKSAQFPTHGWLAEVMETPTPVSALLHAGILNGGPFLIVRLAPLVLLSPGALHALIAIGAVTALFASVVMTTQPTVKGSLAYSSAAHMGFMLLLCGLGMYTIAIAHLIAHSCYKAHAFLAAGSAVELLSAGKVPGGKPLRRVKSFALALGVAFVVVASVGALFGVAVTTTPVMFAVAAMLAIGLAQLVAQAAGSGDGRIYGRIAAATVATAAAFFGLEIAAAHLLHGVVPTAALADRATLVLAALVVAAFATTGLLQVLLPRLGTSPRWAIAYVHVRNGFYANALFDRCVGALRPIANAPYSKEVH